MRRAIDLARRGEGHVEPNPLVGAVLLGPNGETIAEGWHQQFGGPHAEVHALAAAGDRARGATLVVTLEPCCHFGKTPPCSRAVIAAGVKRVMIGTRDPFPKVAGGGIAELRAAGIEVMEGCLQGEADELLAPFRTRIEQHRPFVHAKWAMTLDGKIAAHTGQSKWITTPASRSVVHELRGRMDAILVGIGTALADDPLLTVRPPGPRTPIRVILDSAARLPLASQLVATAREVPTLVCTAASAPADRLRQLREAGVELLPIATSSPASEPSRLPLQPLLEFLARLGFTNILVEGGAGLLGSFLDARLIDEVHAFIAPGLLGGAAALSPIAGTGAVSPVVMPRLARTTLREIDGDLYIRGRLHRDEPHAALSSQAVGQALPDNISAHPTA